MIDFLPLFPLKMVVFPGEQVNLHIFEPRYRQLIRECDENKITFGIPTYLNKKVQPIGTEMKLQKIVKKHPDGAMDITTLALSTFRIDKFYQEAPNKLYAGADIERIKDVDDGDTTITEKILDRIGDLFKLLKIKKTVPTDPVAFYTFNVAHNVGFSIEQEYEFLQIISEKERQDFLLAHLIKMIPVVQEMERLRQKVQMNGHFKNVIPPKF